MTALRLSLFYAVLFGGTGVSLPYIGLWLKAEGLTGAEIGALLAAPMLARVVTGPLIAVWADGFRLRRTALGVLAGVSALAYAALALGTGLAPRFAAWFVAATAIGACVPLIDVLALRRARADGFDFGRPRGVGSLAFVAANVTMGALLAAGTRDLIVLWIVGFAGLACLVALTLLPREPVGDGPTRKRDRFAGLGRLLGDPLFLTAIVSVGLIQAAHAFYYGFSTLVWTEQGISEAWTGLLWAFGVGVEIVFLWFLGPWRNRLGPERLLVLGGAGAVVRWTAMAFAPPLWALWPLQALHALSFAASFMAGLELLERLSPPESATAAQTLSSALSAGLLIGLATVISGPLYDAYGAGGYLAMATMAGLGLVGAVRLRSALRRRPAPG
jgi:PPP family 3-phenylpropionic acid transporter